MARRFYLTRPAWRPWVGLCGVAALGALGVAMAPALVSALVPGLVSVSSSVGGFDAGLLRWQPELAWAQPWRLVTAAWVHLSTLHLVANLAGTAVVAALGMAAGCGRRAALAWALAWPLTQLCLLAQPTLQAYAGLSGVLHAGVAVATWQLVRGVQGRQRALGAAIGLGLVAKLLLEAPWHGPLRQVPGWDIAIAPAAHASGALAGWLCALACGVGSAADRPRQPGG